MVVDVKEISFAEELVVAMVSTRPSKHYDMAGKIKSNLEHTCVKNIVFENDESKYSFLEEPRFNLEYSANLKYSRCHAFLKLVLAILKIKYLLTF